MPNSFSSFVCLKLTRFNIPELISGNYPEKLKENDNKLKQLVRIWSGIIGKEADSVLYRRFRKGTTANV